MEIGLQGCWLLGSKEKFKKDKPINNISIKLTPNSLDSSVHANN